MEDQIKELITSKKKLFLKNRKYIIENNWSLNSVIEEATKNKKKDKVQ